MPHEIHNWEAISDRYNSTILLGNGASIAIDERFDYTSLKSHAEELGTITEQVAEVFSFFGTEDFEFILRVLWHAANVNQALGTEEARTTEAYRSVRQSLIETVRDIHPPQNEIGFPIESAAVFLRRFNKILSLNYDLTTYWAMMVTRGNLERHAFKDCFVNGAFDEDWRRFSTPIRDERRCTTVFYPHGNLALYRNRMEGEGKIAAEAENNLLETILNKWQNGECVPLFVSEGTSSQKVNSILGSNYLRTVLRSVIPGLDESLVVYGWGFGEHDEHILKALSKSSIERIAVSVYGQNQRFCDHVAGAVADHFGGGLRLEFFDAESEHCWTRA